LSKIAIDPTNPALFLLSGGTRIPKLIPRTHKTYTYNSKMQFRVCDVASRRCPAARLAIRHNLPLACPGLQGFMLRVPRGVEYLYQVNSHLPLIERHID